MISDEKFTTAKELMEQAYDYLKDGYEQALNALEEAEAENAKLRTFLGGGSIVTDYWKDEDGTMHVLTTDGEHTYEYMRGGLADENAKLRELVQSFHSAMLCTLDTGLWPTDPKWLEQRMRELGVEP